MKILSFPFSQEIFGGLANVAHKYSVSKQYNCGEMLFSKSMGLVSYTFTFFDILSEGNLEYSRQEYETFIYNQDAEIEITLIPQTPDYDSRLILTSSQTPVSWSGGIYSQARTQ